MTKKQKRLRIQDHKNRNSINMHIFFLNFFINKWLNKLKIIEKFKNTLKTRIIENSKNIQKFKKDFSMLKIPLKTCTKCQVKSKINGKYA